MTIPVTTFQPLSFEQNNPSLYGAMMGSQLVGNNLGNTLTGLQNQAQSITNQYLPQTLQTDIALKQMQAQVMPYQAVASYLGGAGRLLGANNGIVANALRAAQTPGGEQLTSNNPGVAQNVAALLKNAISYGSNASPFGGLMGTFFPGQGPSTPSSSGGSPVSSMINNLVAGIQNGGGANAPSNSIIPPGGQPLPLSQQQISRLMAADQQGGYDPDAQAVQGAALDSYTTKNVPKNIQTQRYFANSVSNMMNAVTPDMPDISSFAGAAGRARMAANKYAAAAGLQSSPAYEKFNNFVNVAAPLASNELRRAFGGQATDAETRLMSNLANPVYWNSNPQLALSQWNYLTNMLHQNEAALGQSQSQALNTLNSNVGAPLASSAPASQSQGAPQMIRVKSKEGTVGMIPVSKLQMALSRGAQVIS